MLTTLISLNSVSLLFSSILSSFKTGSVEGRGTVTLPWWCSCLYHRKFNMLGVMCLYVWICVWPWECVFVCIERSCVHTVSKRQGWKLSTLTKTTLCMAFKNKDVLEKKTTTCHLQLCTINDDKMHTKCHSNLDALVCIYLKRKLACWYSCQGVVIFYLIE